MLKRNILMVSCLFMLCFLFACVGTDTGGGGVQPVTSSNAVPEKRIELLPQRVFMDRQDLPGDVEHVLAAIINVMRGGEEKMPGIGFDPQGEHQILNDPFAFRGFDVKFIDIIFFKTEKALDRVRYALLECGLYFEDDIGRAAYIKIAADYAVSGKEIIIARTEYEILPNPNPVIKAFIVPRQAFEEMPVETRTSFRALYLMASQHAVDMTPTDQDKARYDQFRQMSMFQRLRFSSGARPRSYCVLVFCMNRLRPESRFLVSVSKDDEPTIDSTSRFHFRNDAGWVAGLLAGTFSIDAYDKEVFFHVLFNSGIDPSNMDMKPVARFSSLKNYHAAQRTEPENPYIKEFKERGMALNLTPARSLSDQNFAGPVEKGEVFLNPALAKDAKMIQQELKGLGYYTMKIDGAFGKGSRRALKAFKQANGLPADARWDLNTQKVLFKGSGL
ncbi:MAG: hypothetical protein D3926_23900 [Desulfobacteraceae bacterium]|nr:MAG: hypothetical protein D3926_23900 [Desulfobacteraceae bacterium]